MAYGGEFAIEGGLGFGVFGEFVFADEVVGGEEAVFDGVAGSDGFAFGGARAGLAVRDGEVGWFGERFHGFCSLLLSRDGESGAAIPGIRVHRGWGGLRGRGGEGVDLAGEIFWGDL